MFSKYHELVASLHERAITSIPVFNEKLFRSGYYTDNTLLRFRGIIRDVRDPEFIVIDASNPSLNTFNPTTAISSVNTTNNPSYVQRIPLKVALLSYASDWASQLYQADSRCNTNVTIANSTVSFSGLKGAKRPQELSNDSRELSTDIRENVINANSSGFSNLEADTHQNNTLQNSAMQKKLKSSDGTTMPSEFLENVLNIYIYEGMTNSNLTLDVFKLNETLEFIGLLDLTVLEGPAKKVETQSANHSDEEALKDLYIASLLDTYQCDPRQQTTGVVFHCCDAMQLNSISHAVPHQLPSFYKHENNQSRCLALYSACKSQPSISSNITDKDIVIFIRKQILNYIANYLCGDEIAAEYLLLTLLSRVYGRADNSTPMGNLSLNLVLGTTSDCNDIRNRADEILKLISSLVPMYVRIPMSLSTLNNEKLTPSKDYERDLLYSSSLQVPQGTVIVLDETVLETGHLNELGIRNVNTIQSLATKMVLPYDFKFYEMEFPMDVPIVCISETKSILNMTLACTVKTTSSFDTSASVIIEESGIVSCFRIFLALLRDFDVTIGNEMAEAAEKYYVSCRKAQADAISMDDLHRWIRLARLLALSYGESQTSLKSWEKMLALEAKRVEQIQNA